MNERKQIIRDIVLDIISGREKLQSPPNQLPHLEVNVVEVMIRRKIEPSGGQVPYDVRQKLSNEDADIVREVFWDLVIEKIITVGFNSSNPDFPWFKLHSECGTI